MRSLPDLLHPDSLTGAVTRVLHRLTPAAPNTLADLDAYRGLSPGTLFPTPPATPAVSVKPRWSLPGLVSEDLVFSSLHEPIEAKFRQRYLSHYRETHTVYARRLRPVTSRQRPRLLYLHGYLQPETYVEELSLLAGMALRLDVEVIQLQLPYHGRRTPRGSRFGGELFWTADLVRSVEAVRQSVVDVRTLLGWLLEVDQRPVGILGLSLGGALAAILTCLDDRFAFSVPLIAHMDPQALFAASDDRFFAPAVVEEMWRRWGRPAIRWYPCSHMGFIPRLPEVVGAVREFIDRQADPQADPRAAARADAIGRRPGRLAASPRVG